MSTVAELISRTIRQHLEMGGPSQINRLAIALNATAESLTLDWEPEIDLAPGVYLEVGSEAMLVIGSSGIGIDVLRAQWGTVATAHAQADLVRVAPRFLRSQVHTEITDEIRSWPATLFGVTTAEVSWPTSYHDVDLTGAEGKQITRLLNVHVEPLSGGPWGDITTAVSVHPASTTDYESGWRLHSLRGGSTSDIRVSYAHEFDFTELEDESADLVEDCGLSVGMEDIARFGAAARLMTSQESERARVDVQGQTRFGEETPPQHQLTAADGLMKLRDKRLQDEEERLVSRWGV